MRVKYTHKDLVKIKEEYNDNFYLLCLAKKPSKEHDDLIQIERKLYEKEVTIQKSLGIYLQNPCPTQSSINCTMCSGYYKKTYHFSKKIGRSVLRLKQVRPNTTNALTCPLKKGVSYDPTRKGM